MLVIDFFPLDLTDRTSFDKAKYWVDQLKAAEPVSIYLNGVLVSKETVVLRRWESETKIWFYETS